MIGLLLCAALGTQPVAEPPPLAMPPPVAAAGSGAQAAVVALLDSGKVVSGVLVSDLGLVVTTARSFNRLGLVVPTSLIDGRNLEARVVLVDPARDLALLRLPAGAEYPSVPIAPTLPEEGAPLTVAYQPGSVTWASGTGVVGSRFALRDGHPDPLFFRVDLSGSVKGEGGAILDQDGRLVGLLASSNGGGVEWGVATDPLRAFLDKVGPLAAELSLSIHTEPPGAAVKVDGKDVGVTSVGPLRVEHLTPGVHQVQLTLAGAAEDRLAVTLLQHHEASLDRHLDSGGQVELSANAAAEAWVDGASRGQVPLFLTLPSGSHQLDLRAPGCEPASRAIEVVAGTRQAVTVQLAHLYAQLSLNSVPPGAQVTVNGDLVGATPLQAVAVPSGAAEIGISDPHHHRYRFKITLAPREARDLGTYRLEDPYGWLEPVQLPAGTLVAIDAGQRHPLQPFERVDPGEHRVEILAPSYYAFSQQITVADSQTITLDPPLKLYDRLPPRKAAALFSGGLGVSLGLVSLGFLTDSSTSRAAAPTAMAGLAALGAAAYFLATSPSSDEPGWTEHETWTREGSAP